MTFRQPDKPCSLRTGATRVATVSALVRLPGVVLFGLAAVCFSGIPATALHAQENIDTRREYNVKAAAMYGFCQFVTWPDTQTAGPADPLVIAVYGDSPITPTLREIATKRNVNGRPIDVRVWQKVTDVKACHILFVSNGTTVKVQKELIEITRDRHVLLVGEQSGFAVRGGVLNFVIEDGRVQFEINAGEARTRELLLDAKLLRLGKALPDPGQERHASESNDR